MHAVLLFTTDFTDETDSVLSEGKNRSKSLLRSPGLTPLQPDAYAQPCKRASLSDPPHPTGLPTGRQETNKTK